VLPFLILKSEIQRRHINIQFQEFIRFGVDQTNFFSRVEDDITILTTKDISKKRKVLGGGGGQTGNKDATAFSSLLC